MNAHRWVAGAGGWLAGRAREPGCSEPAWSRTPTHGSASSTCVKPSSQLLLRGGMQMPQPSICAITNRICVSFRYLYYCTIVKTTPPTLGAAVGFVAELSSPYYPEPQLLLVLLKHSLLRNVLVLLPTLGVILLEMVSDPCSPDEKPLSPTYSLLIFLQKAEQRPVGDDSNLLTEGRLASKPVFHTEQVMWWTLRDLLCRLKCAHWLAPEVRGGLRSQPDCLVETPIDTRHRQQVHSYVEAPGSTQTLNPGYHVYHWK